MTPLQTIQQSARRFEEMYGDTDVYPNDLIPKNDVMATHEHIKSHILSSTIKLLQSQIEAREGMKIDIVDTERETWLEKYKEDLVWNSALQACNEADRELIKELTK